MEELDRLIEAFQTEVDVLWARLQNGEISAIAWQDEMEVLITRFHTASFMVGNGTTDIDEAGRDTIQAFIDFQIGFLASFSLTLLSALQWKEGWQARAQSYAKAIKVSYWNGRTSGLPLPSMPAEGTICLSNCGCQWRIVTLDAENGDYDAFWVRHKDDSCQTCLEREEQWNPVQIRGGVLMESMIKEVDIEQLEAKIEDQLVKDGLL